MAVYIIIPYITQRDHTAELGRGQRRRLESVSSRQDSRPRQRPRLQEEQQQPCHDLSRRRDVSAELDAMDLLGLTVQKKTGDDSTGIGYYINDYDYPIYSHNIAKAVPTYALTEDDINL